MATSLAGTGKMVGAEVRRVEDPRVLLGKSRYVDDIHLPGTLGLAFVRSPHAHARILNIDVSAAQSYPGVEAVLTGAEVAKVIKPLRVEYDPTKAPTHKSCDWPVLAQGKVRFVGEAVAVVVATNRYVAEDAAALVEVEYEPIDVIWDMEKALESDSPLVHEEWGDNVMQVLQAEIGEVTKAFQEADCVVSERFTTGRHLALPMETRGCLAHYEAATDSLTVWSSTQVPHLLRSRFALLLDFPEHHIRVIAPDVGGGFGPKAHVFPEEALVPFLARRLGQPVKWIEDRRENLSASLHAKHQVVQAELALKKDGTILGLKGRFVCDVGAPFWLVAVAVKFTIATAPIEAPTDCDPRDEPRVHSVAPFPFESEVACVGNTEPSPDAGANVIVDPATGFPCVSVTRTTRGAASSVPPTPDCWSPETFTSSAGGPVSAMAVRTTGASPGTSTVTSWVPGVVPRIQPPTVATPNASVRTLWLGVT